ncbi:sterol desaturase family protein [Hyphomonas chukchiensis]|uniref:sterol desaturase family protein n=1 Tax=Hyphomonas chukchiensis TaxID=1280947 RepID=UPI0030F58E8F
MLALLVERFSPQFGWLAIVGVLIGVFLIRYIAFAGSALALVTLFRTPLKHRRLQPQPFSRDQLMREGLYSLLTMLIFGLVGMGAYTLQAHFGIYQIYNDIDAHGWLWLFASIPTALLVHDFYFYWAHRFMHLPGIYQRVHKVHHLSTNPSPLAAFAFHPLEAVIEALGFVVILVVVPLHPVAFFAVSTLMITYNVMGHLGYELLPHGLPDKPVAGLMNTATSHNQHHRTYRYNYGLYTLIWDHLFGTFHPRYAETYADATQPENSQITA